jgi:caffeoyl-CoA O-methyltransferase
MAFEIVANLDDLEPGETLFVEGLREPICLVRLDDDDVRAVHNTCTHQQQPLHEGTVQDDDTLVCASHNSRFDLTTGESIGIPVGLAIAPEQGTLMTLLTQLTGAVSAIEIGTFTGYSSICIARGLAPGGHLLCCDISEEWTSVARKYWEKAGLSDRIELRLGQAIDTLRWLPDEEIFDLAFIDADKGGYLGYWREVVPRVRPGGLIMVDNTFSHGRVIDAGNDNPLVIAVRDFNDHAAADDRVDLVIVPIGDGLTLARKRD